MFSSSGRMASPPPNLPFKFRRKSSTTSTGVSFQDPFFEQDRDTTSPSSPLPSSSPLLTPGRPYWAQDCRRGSYGVHGPHNPVIGSSYDDLDDTHNPWSYPVPKDSASQYRVHRPLPSLMSKFRTDVEDTLRDPHSHTYFQNSPLSSRLYSQGDSALADACEEYDLESLDIHVRETYFATSAERGRWQSSPLAPRTRTQTFLSSPVRPMRGHSTPVKNAGINGMAGAFELKERTRRQSTSSIANSDHSITSFLQEEDDDHPYASSLPPSSPLISPVSFAPSLLDHLSEDDAIIDQLSHPNPDHSTPSTTPELSASSVIADGSRDSSADAVVALTSLLASPSSASACLPLFQNEDASHFSSATVITPGPSPSSISVPVPVPLAPDDVVTEASKSHPGHRQSPIMENAELAGATESIVSPVSGKASLLLSQLKVEESTSVLFATSPQTSAGCVAKKTAKKPHLDRDFAEDDTSEPHLQLARRSSAARLKSADSLPEKAHEPQLKIKREDRRPRDGLEPPRKKRRVLNDEGKVREDGSSCQSHKRSGRKKRSCSPSTPHSRDTSPEEDLACQLARICDEVTPPPSPRGRSRSLTKGAPSTSHGRPSDPPDLEVDAELTGMLIEALATSRASSMDPSSLYITLTRTHPNVKSERPKKEFLKLISAVLEAGRKRCGMFEKVDSSGKASRHQPIDGRWFYVPERDEDKERASLISAIMPRQKRSETKKYKQYYYKPLDKISRWDPEDAP